MGSATGATDRTAQDKNLTALIAITCCGASDLGSSDLQPFHISIGRMVRVTNLRAHVTLPAINRGVGRLVIREIVWTVVAQRPYAKGQSTSRMTRLS